MSQYSKERSAHEIIGDNLRDLRTLHGLTQEELGWPDHEGNTICRIENGKQPASAKLLDSLLGRLGENTFPWGYLFSIKDYESSAIKLELISQLRVGLLTGTVAAFYSYFTGKPYEKLDECQSEYRLQELIEQYSDRSLDVDDVQFLDFIKKTIFDYPLCDPLEVIEKDKELLFSRRKMPSGSLRLIFLPNETEMMIMGDIALRHMELKNYSLAIELWQSLLEKHMQAIMVSPSYWRSVMIYRYNLSLCMLFEGRINESLGYARDSLIALTKGGDLTLSLYALALFARIRKSINDLYEYEKRTHLLNMLIGMISKHIDFKYTVEDLTEINKGIPAI